MAVVTQLERVHHIQPRLEPTTGHLQNSSPSFSLRQAPRTATRRQQYLHLMDGERCELTQTTVKCLFSLEGRIPPLRVARPGLKPEQVRRCGRGRVVGGAWGTRGLWAEPCPSWVEGNGSEWTLMLGGFREKRGLRACGRDTGKGGPQRDAATLETARRH